LIRNPRNLRGFSETERQPMGQIARGSGGVRALQGFADLFKLNSQTGLAALGAAFW
jgi:hypothetical protein